MQEQNKTVVRTLFLFTGAAFLGSILVLFSALIGLERPGITAVAGAIGTVSCLVFFWLLTNRHFTLPRYLVPFMAYVLGTFLTYRVSVHDESQLFYPLALALAGLLLGRRGIVIFGVMIVLTTSLVALTQLGAETTLLTILILALMNGIIAAMMYVLVNMLQENFEKISVDQKLLSEANRELELGHTNLENQIRERTQAAETSRAEAEQARAAAEAARSGLEAQVWLATGQTQLADAMRGEQETSKLARNVISQLCGCLAAQAGALYLLENKTLTLAGTFAFTERPGLNDTIQLGQGLVGQAALEEKMLDTKVIPPDTMLITTGLVSIMPRQVIAFPFHANGQVVGVVELATLSSFTRDHLTLLRRTSENIGIAFLTERTRERLADLLLETQQQAEELQAQEEELRAANEELQAQAENLKASRLRKAWKDAE